MMQCDICFETGGSRRPFLCPVDARNALYEPRIKHAQVLLENCELDQKISAITLNDTSSTEDGPESHTVESWKATEIVAFDKTQQIIARADELRDNIKAARAEIARRKAGNATRKSELESAKNGLVPRRSRLLEEADKKAKMTTFKWNKVHNQAIVSRAYLCAEVSNLYGLRRLKDPHGAPSESYSIAGVRILDLRAMCNKARPSEITASFSHIAHLLMLCTHYLSIRLPAEIILPHRDYPLPTIFSLKDSYKTTNVPFLGTSSTSSNTSPTTSRHEEVTRQPRPRPLFINKPLPALTREDLYMFLEGAALLAYNIAWVCKSQGVSVGLSKGTTLVEDVFELGPNLYRLLIGIVPRPSPLSRPSTRPTPSRLTSRGTEATDSEDGRFTTSVGPSVGHFSHGTAHSYLGGTQGNDFLRTFKLPSYTKISEQLKQHVISEVAGTEWTLVGDDATIEDGDDPEDGDSILVGGRRSGESPKSKSMKAMLATTTGLGDFGAASFMTMQTADGNEGDERRQGTRGWTILKDRS